MSGLDLGHKVGPLPLGAWIAVVAGGVGVAVYRSRQSAAAAAAAADPLTNTSGDPGVGTGAVGGYVDNTTTAPPAPNAITDNASWAVQATNYLIAQNYDPALSDSAVRKYLASAPLSVTEYALIKVVLLKFGVPPERLPQTPAIPPVTPQTPDVKPPQSVPTHVTPAPKPPTKAPVKKSSGITYTVAPGDNLTKLALRTWGTPNWQRIYNANKSVIGSNPNLIRPGMVLQIV